MLNTAWAETVVVGRWLSFDEQMVKSVGRSAKFMMKHMPKKPIKNGKCFVSRAVFWASTPVVFTPPETPRFVCCAHSQGSGFCG